MTGWVVGVILGAIVSKIVVDLFEGAAGAAGAWLEDVADRLTQRATGLPRSGRSDAAYRRLNGETGSSQLVMALDSLLRGVPRSIWANANALRQARILTSVASVGLGIGFAVFVGRLISVVAIAGLGWTICSIVRCAPTIGRGRVILGFFVFSRWTQQDLSQPGRPLWWWAPELAVDLIFLVALGFIAMVQLRHLLSTVGAGYVVKAAMWWALGAALVLWEQTGDGGEDPGAALLGLALIVVGVMSMKMPRAYVVAAESTLDDHLLRWGIRLARGGVLVLAVAVAWKIAAVSLLAGGLPLGALGWLGLGSAVIGLTALGRLAAAPLLSEDELEECGQVPIPR